MTNDDLAKQLLAGAELQDKATPGPWEWNGYGPGGDPQLEGTVEAPDMNPVLVCRGCCADGCCWPKHEFRRCPLHPSDEDRAFIAASRSLPLRQAAAALEALRVENERLRAVVREIQWCSERHRHIVDDDGCVPCCPVCGADSPKHRPKCEIAALLGERHDA